MLIRSKRGWELPETEATPEGAFLNRRAFLKAASLPLIAAALPLPALAAGEAARRNPRFALDRAMTDETLVTTYNNFMEFGSQKDIWRAAQKLRPRPWTVAIDGLVAKPETIDVDTLIAAMPVEERLYRHRCVEAWAMAVPWTGFPLKALLDRVQPQGSAKYVALQTFKKPDVATGQKQFWYPWPYQEAMTIEEAANDLAFMVTGAYGKPLLPQNGAPLRLAVPWKYGFKSGKSIARITFTKDRPKTFWSTVEPDEYGFWANVNPKVDHPRWSQATERMLGTDERRPTQIYNGYGEFVASLYTGLEDQPLFM
ncbi:MAG TPA: protein-methionine-sulfoxide reductase catalytic subunit MsrP [Azospirillaceae bacterium]|nr:protein-methionine-sulfoxide reductase catalytic subunit MsrP [Azospirillaceae bacterium]